MRLDLLRLKAFWYDYREIFFILCLSCFIFSVLFSAVHYANNQDSEKFNEGCRSLGAIPYKVKGKQYCINKGDQK